MDRTYRRIRPGYYESSDVDFFSGYTVERLDEAAEHYPEDGEYGRWRVFDCSEGEYWLATFATLKAAQQAIEEG